MNPFWIETIPVEQAFKKLIQKKYTSIWDFLRENRSKNKTNYFIYPLAVSDTFYGFNNDLGNMPYEEQEQEVNDQFIEYKAQISQLLQQQPTTSLLPQPLDFEKVKNEKEWDVYYGLMDSYSLAYEFEGNFTVWSQKDMVLFLSVSKEDKELPYEIHFGGIDLEYYQKVLNAYHTIKQDIESGVYADFADEEDEGESEEEYYEKYFNKLSIQAVIKDREHHDLVGKNSAIKKYLKQNEELPKVFDDGKLLIFHALDSVNYIVNPLRNEDVEFVDLILQNGANAQLSTKDLTTGMQPVLYAYARGLNAFADFLQTKGASLQKELTNPKGHQILLDQLTYSTHYRREKLIQNILPFIPNKLVKPKAQTLWEKLAKGHSYGKAETITNLFINKGLNPETPLSNGTNILTHALLLNDEKWIQALQPYLPIDKCINQTDTNGNSILHLWTAVSYNNDLSNKGISALKHIVGHTAVLPNRLNHKQQTTLHLLGTHEVDPYNEKDQKQVEIDALQQAFALISSKTNNINQQDKEGNTALHYFAGYHFLKAQNNTLKPIRFNKTNEQKWRVPIIKKLIAQGAKASVKNKIDLTPKEIAILCKMDGIYKIFTD